VARHCVRRKDFDAVGAKLGVEIIARPRQSIRHSPISRPVRRQVTERIGPNALSISWVMKNHGGAEVRTTLSSSAASGAVTSSSARTAHEQQDFRLRARQRAAPRAAPCRRKAPREYLRRMVSADFADRHLDRARARRVRS